MKVEIMARKKGDGKSPWKAMPIPVESVEDAKAKIRHSSEVLKKGLEFAIRVTTLEEQEPTP